MTNAKAKAQSDVVPLAQARRQRVSNAERTAQTRKELLEATIECLYRYGYGATTTHLVAEVAGLSRGAIVHHFPTKTDLMVEAVQFAWAKEQQDMREGLEKYPPGLPRFEAIIDEHWEIVRRPQEIAIQEIRIGSRSDPLLAEAVHPIMAEISKEYGRWVGGIIREAGLEPDEDLRSLTIAWVMSLPMLAFYWQADPNPRMEQSLLHTLHAQQRAIIERQLAAKGK